MYSLEVYSAVVWGNVIRCREAQSYVSYPSEVDDKSFSNTDYNESVPFKVYTNPDPNCWLHGWNFATDLYRLLEHAMNDYHQQHPSDTGPPSLSKIFGKEALNQRVVLQGVDSAHEILSKPFKEVESSPQLGKGGDVDKFAFQTANINALLQLVRLVLLTISGAAVEELCAVARDHLDGFSNIPDLFLRAISTPLLHHIVVFSTILSSVMHRPLSETSYLQVRKAL